MIWSSNRMLSPVMVRLGGATFLSPTPVLSAPASGFRYSGFRRQEIRRPHASPISDL